jgi:two-component system, sensor histidine kinase and response regulator
LSVAEEHGYFLLTHGAAADSIWQKGYRHTFGALPRPADRHTDFTMVCKHHTDKVCDKDTWKNMPTQIPEINLDLVLNSIGGNTGLLRRILRSFLEQFSDVEEKLKRYLAQGDAEQVKRLIHNIKGTAGNIGAETLFCAARNLEYHLKSDPASKSGSALDLFIESHRRVISSLENLNFDRPPEEAFHSDPDSPLDIDKIIAVLRDMELHLKKSDSRMRHLLPGLRALLSGPLLASELECLDRAIYRLDSDQALECLQDISTKLNISIKEDEESSDVD